MLDSNSFTKVDKESLNFLKDVHSWKWYFACGRRMMIVGVGVSNRAFRQGDENLPISYVHVAKYGVCLGHERKYM